MNYKQDAIKLQASILKPKQAVKGYDDEHKLKLKEELQGLEVKEKTPEIIDKIAALKQEILNYQKTQEESNQPYSEKSDSDLMYLD